MPVGAIIGGVVGAAGSVGSALIGSSAAKNAANAQLQAAQQAQALQMQMFNTAKDAEQPYNTVGQGAVNSLASLYGIGGSGSQQGAMNNASLAAFTNSPDYQFAFNQGLQGMQRAAAAGGTLVSGGQLKAGQEFGQGLATQQFGNYFNRLLSLSQLGQNAAGGIATAAGTAGGQIGNSIQAGGQAQASGIVGSANALSGGINGATGSLGTAMLAQKLFGQNSNNSNVSSYTPPSSWNLSGTGTLQQPALLNNMPIDT